MIKLEIEYDYEPIISYLLDYYHVQPDHNYLSRKILVILNNSNTSIDTIIIKLYSNSINLVPVHTRSSLIARDDRVLLRINIILLLKCIKHICTTPTHDSYLVQKRMCI
jgi:hypothetical protein